MVFRLEHFLRMWTVFTGRVDSPWPYWPYWPKWHRWLYWPKWRNWHDC